jgi:hypothetical protein
VRRATARLVLGMVILGVGGCRSSGKAVDNPVVGPKPPRMAEEILAQLEAAEGGSSESRGTTSGGSAAEEPQILQVSATQEVIRDEDIAARVNGKPIFVSEVLERYRPALEEQRSRMTPQAYHQLRRQLIEKELEGHIEQALVLDAIRKKFKTEQWEELQRRLDEFFYESELPDLQERVEAKSLQEVEATLQKHGTTLSAYRRAWGDRQLAAQWVREQLPTATVSRQELLAAYQERIDQYREPEQIRWQQCWISNVASGGREGARARMQQAVEDLKNGMSFDDVVRKHSDGPLAKTGGHWDWANPDSLANDRLRQTLQELQVNQVGPVLEDEKGFQLVKLTGRRPARVQPFEDVQQELRESLLQQKREAAAKELIQKLRAEAHIETMFDRQKPRS